MKMGSLEFTKNFLMNVNGMYTVNILNKLATRRVSKIVVILVDDCLVGWVNFSVLGWEKNNM